MPQCIGNCLVIFARRGSPSHDARNLIGHRTNVRLDVGTIDAIHCYVGVVTGSGAKPASPLDAGLIMFGQDSNPAFEARSLSSAHGWYVRVVWPHGKREHIPGFVSRREAVRWIEEKAKAWLSERDMGTGAFPTRPHRPHQALRNVDPRN